MFQSKTQKSSRDVRHAGNSVCVQSHDMWCTRAFNTQLPRVIAELAIHYRLVMDDGALARTNELSCWHAKSHPLIKNA